VHVAMQEEYGMSGVRDSEGGVCTCAHVGASFWSIDRGAAASVAMVSFPKSARTHCPKCNKHMAHSVSQYKKGKDSLVAQGKRRYDRKQKGFGGQTKPIFHKKAKTTKKIVVLLQCQECSHKLQRCIGRCKTFVSSPLTEPHVIHVPHVAASRFHSFFHVAVS
jgi:large subunit ribosomal protein L44e